MRHPCIIDNHFQNEIFGLEYTNSNHSELITMLDIKGAKLKHNPKHDHKNPIA